MSESSTPVHKPSDAERQAHGLPKGKHVAGHRVQIAGRYFAFDDAGEKVKRDYSVSLTLPAHAGRLHGQGALGHALSAKLLEARLREKDPQFRSIHTHEVTAHENIFVDAPVPDEEGLDEGEPETPEQEEEAAAEQQEA